MEEVLWCPVITDDNTPENQTWKNIAYFEPEPLLKNIILSRNKDADYLICPAYNAYFKNTFNGGITTQIFSLTPQKLKNFEIQEKLAKNKIIKK